MEWLIFTAGLNIQILLIYLPLPLYWRRGQTLETNKETRTQKY